MNNHCDKLHEELVDKISEFLGDRAMNNPHYLFDDEIVSIFKSRGYKKKDIKKALEDVR